MTNLEYVQELIRLGHFDSPSGLMVTHALDAIDAALAWDFAEGQRR